MQVVNGLGEARAAPELGSRPPDFAAITVAGRDTDEWRDALVARVDSCWERLSDAVSDLRALHRVPLSAILERVNAAGRAEDD